MAMMKKIKDLLAEILFSSSGTTYLSLAIMLFLAFFNLINRALLLGTNALMLPMVSVAFVCPFWISRASRGNKMKIPSFHLALPKRIHLPTVALGTLVLFFGSALLKFAFYDEVYTEFSLYGAFFARRNGSVWNDIYIAFAFCIVPPLLEGIIYRGAVIKELDKHGRLTAVLFSSLFFALVGLNGTELLPRFFAGALLCMILYATDSLAVSIGVHIAYNLYATFAEPTIVSLKHVSSSPELVALLLALVTLALSASMLSHLSRLYKKYSHDRFGKSAKRSTPRAKTAHDLAELMLSPAAIACYVFFIAVNLIS